MNTTLRTDITVEDICKGFVYNEYEGKGLFGLCSDVLPNIISRAKNNLMIFTYSVILCTQAYNFFPIEKH